MSHLAPGIHNSAPAKWDGLVLQVPQQLPSQYSHYTEEELYVPVVQPDGGVLSGRRPGPDQARTALHSMHAGLTPMLPGMHRMEQGIRAQQGAGRG